MLVGRDQELSRLTDLLTEACAGHGVAALVEGPAGIGKTTLLGAVEKAAAQHQAAVLTSRGGELEHALAFSIVRQLFEPPLRAAPAGVRADLLAGAASRSAPVFGGSSPGNDAAADMGAVVHGLYWLCSNLAERQPLLIVVDDVHWADDSSMRFISHLARRITGLPALLILAGRPPAPGDTGPAGRALSGVQPQTLRLGPLSDDAVGILVRAVLSPDAEELFCAACARASGGNPFILSETLATLRAQRVHPAASEVDRIATLRPDTISAAVLARLARLGPHAIRLGRAIAVLGPGASLRTVAALSEMDHQTAAETIDALGHENILTPYRPIQFVHTLVRTAIYADTSETLQALLHKRAAQMLAAEGTQPTDLTQHLLAAEPASDPWVVDTLRTAATTALAKGAPESAAVWLTRALAEPPEANTQVPLLMELGRTMAMLNRPAEATQALQKAAELAEDPHIKAEIILELATLLFMAGRGRQALQLFERVQQVDDHTDSDLPLRVLAGISFGSIIAMRPPAAWMPQLDQVTPLLRGTSDAERAVLAALSFGAAGTGDRPNHQVAHLAALAANGPLPEHDPGLLVNLASGALEVAGQSAAALDLLDRGVDTARQRGDVAAYAYLCMLRSHTIIRSGRLPSAEADGRNALGFYQDRQERNPLAAAVLIDALVAQGQIEAAQQTLSECGLESGQPMETIISHFILMARAQLRLSQNRPHEAIADLHACGEGLTAAGFTNPAFAPWRTLKAAAHLAAGDTAAARELADEELDLARQFQAPRAIGIALRVAGTAEGGSNGLSLLHEAVVTLEQSSDVFEYARALTEYGAALRRATKRAAATAPLRLGLDLATRCNAQPLANRAHEELKTAGLRPRRLQIAGLGSLTDTELRVARMAADGLTNQDIASALYIVKRTVESHLTSAYRKLGISSRHQLPEQFS